MNTSFTMLSQKPCWWQIKSVILSATRSDFEYNSKLFILKHRVSTIVCLELGDSGNFSIFHNNTHFFLPFLTCFSCDYNVVHLAFSSLVFIHMYSRNWSNPEGQGIDDLNQTIPKHYKAQTICITIEIYCKFAVHSLYSSITWIITQSSFQFVHSTHGVCIEMRYQSWDV